MSQDFYSAQFSDGTLTVTMSPPTPVGNWTVRYREFVHHGGGQPLILASGQQSGLLQADLITKWCGSGTGGGDSGITVLNSGNGIFRVSLPASELSGRDPGAYAYSFERTDSGYHKALREGYRLVT